MKEYDDKPILPPPLVVQVHLIRLIKWIFIQKGKISKKESKKKTNQSIAYISYSSLLH